MRATYLPCLNARSQNQKTTEIQREHAYQQGIREHAHALEFAPNEDSPQSRGTSLPGPVGQTTAGVTALTGSSYNALSWTAVSGAAWYDVIRVSTGGSPATVGKIEYTVGTTFNDTGLAGTTYTNLTYNLEEYLRTLGLRTWDPVGGTNDKPGWTQLGIEAHARGW
jgi:hypothetical protein